MKLKHMKERVLMEKYKTNEGPPSIEKGIYRHNKKGHLYEVVGVATHSETGEPVVVYRPLYESEHEFFIRPYGMFTEAVELDGEMKPRFEKIDE